MTPLKINRAFKLAGITMPAVREHILRQLEPQRASLQGITAAQLAAVLVMAKAIYHEGRASTGASVADDAVWIGAGVDKLIPLAALRGLTIDHQVETVRRPYTHTQYPHAASIRDAGTGDFVGRDVFESRKIFGVASDYYYDETVSATHMHLSYTERV